MLGGCEVPIKESNACLPMKLTACPSESVARRRHLRWMSVRLPAFRLPGHSGVLVCQLTACRVTSTADINRGVQLHTAVDSSSFDGPVGPRWPGSMAVIDAPTDQMSCGPCVGQRCGNVELSQCFRRSDQEAMLVRRRS